MAFPPTDKKNHWLEVIFSERVFLPGTEGVIVPSGNVSERPTSPLDGTIRYNTQLVAFEGYYDGLWRQFPIGTVVGEANTMSNIGGGEEVFKQKTGVDFELRTLVAGTNINVNTIGDTIVIDASAAGEANTASNIGGWAGVFESKVGVDLRFRTLRSNVPGALSITQNPSEITFDLIGAPYLSLSGGTMTGDINFGPGARLVADGAATGANPPITFNSDPDSGMYSYGPDQLGFAVNGSAIFFTRTNGVLAAVTPSYETFISNDQDIVNKKYVDDLITAIPDHVEVAGDSMTGTLTMTGAAQVFGSIAGTAASPSYAFDTMGATGLFPVGGNSIGFATTGAHRWTITGGGSGGDLIPASPSAFDIGSLASPVDNVISNRFQASAGTSALPAHTFSADTTSGMYLTGGVLGFSTGGSSRWTIDASGHLIPSLASSYDIGNTGSRAGTVYANKLSASLASAALPSIYLGLDTNTGMWGPAGDTIGFATAGLDRMQIQPNGLIHAETATYESLVTAGDDNSIPNKKYVTDLVGAAVPSVLDDLTDVTITAPVINAYLQYNGAGQWVDVDRIIQINDADDDSFVNVDFGGSDSDTVKIQAGSNPGANAGTISIETLAAVTPNFTGGDINMQAGDGIDAKGGDLLFEAGEGTYSAVGGNGGDIDMIAGDGYGPLAATAFRGGNVTIQGGPGAGVDTTGGTVKLVGGNGRGASNAAGDVVLEAGNHDTGTNLGQVVLTPGIPTGGGITGAVHLRSKALSTKAVELKFEEGASTDYVGLKAPDSVLISRTWVLPTDDPTVAAGNFMTTDASGNLSFTAPPSASYRQSFTNGSLVGSILSVNHGLGQKYCQVTVYSDLDRIIAPDYTTAIDANNVDIDLSSFAPLSGTWNIVVTA